jgi:hypothetical protein
MTFSLLCHGSATLPTDSLQVAESTTNQSGTDAARRHEYHSLRILTGTIAVLARILALVWANVCWLASFVDAIVGKRLTYARLIAEVQA